MQRDDECISTMFKTEQECEYTLSNVDQELFGMSNAAVSLDNLLNLETDTIMKQRFNAKRGMGQYRSWRGLQLIIIR